ncbi:hypothetical protein DKM44_00780 [Deinococcus irradiatisoli]|uniref:3-oxo-tetronate kinase n=1 Tax=Deinococcus irradiatisoli TaxID=2202254 RepID=A0A2Z3JGA8_9DEIO|nr:3-oxo-tetronate kinase [Deinococcus irradiatisoli]AWN21949.1 hypothetical protein DKM44_00780 [Deinococcus irradiatisoli]
MRYGCIADDFTGASDLANTLTQQGFQVAQLLGVPPEGVAAPGGADALVVALKSRTLPAGEAVAQSLAALHWLQQQGCQRFYFKYCSTFDSTPSGNIGPVTEALLDALNADWTIICPAFPATGRTVYQGHLFVHGALLSDSPMRHHPLTPMTDANLLRLLGAQTQLPVGLLPYAEVRRGAEAAPQALDHLARQGRRLIVTDALTETDLRTLAEATQALPLITGASGLAVGLRPNGSSASARALPAPAGRRAILSGSASAATLEQIGRARALMPSLKLDVLNLADDFEAQISSALHWAGQQPPDAPFLIYGSGTPEEVQQAQARLGAAQAGALLERALAVLAGQLVAGGVRQLIVAGGETSAAALQALEVQLLHIGPEIAPGVPWTLAEREGEPLYLALKSGNFGGPDFFLEAWKVLEGVHSA